MRPFAPVGIGLTLPLRHNHYPRAEGFQFGAYLQHVFERPAAVGVRAAVEVPERGGTARSETLANLKVIEGFGPNTGFTSTLEHIIVDAADLSLRDFRLVSSQTIQNAGIGDSATACYLGGYLQHGATCCR